MFFEAPGRKNVPRCPKRAAQTLERGPRALGEVWQEMPETKKTSFLRPSRDGPSDARLAFFVFFLFVANFVTALSLPQSSSVTCFENPRLFAGFYISKKNAKFGCARESGQPAGRAGGAWGRPRPRAHPNLVFLLFLFLAADSQSTTNHASERLREETVDCARH